MVGEMSMRYFGCSTPGHLQFVTTVIRYGMYVNCDASSSSILLFPKILLGIFRFCMRLDVASLEQDENYVYL